MGSTKSLRRVIETITSEFLAASSPCMVEPFILFIGIQSHTKSLIQYTCYLLGDGTLFLKNASSILMTHVYISHYFHCTSGNQILSDKVCDMTRASHDHGPTDML